MNIHTATAVLLCLAALTTGACVKRSTYAVAVADLEATKSELHSTKTQAQLLTGQVGELQQHRIDIARQMESVTSGFRQATQQMEADRAVLQKRLSRLSRMISQLTAQQNSLRYAFQRETKAQPRLQAMVEQYKSQLEEVGAPAALVSTSPVERTNQPVEAVPSDPVVAQTVPAPQPAITTPAAPANPTAVDPTLQPVNKQPSPQVQPANQGEEDWLSVIKEWFASLLESIFS